MPDSPDSKTSAAAPLSPAASLPPTTPISRPLSTSSSSQLLNGGHSPGHSSMNGRTPSPPAMGNSVSAQQLPPACGARQLSKLKRFLTTLQQFGSDISPEIGERVRSLVLGLVNNHLSIEEFHSKLQEATNFPLRPFVIPFLKANLPLLQRELLHCARLAKQSPQQYLAHNEHILFDPSHSPLEPSDMNAPEFNENGKRRSPDSRTKENGYEGSESGHPAKRHQPLSPSSSGGSTSNHVSPNSAPYNFQLGGPIRLEDISLSREMRERERLERERLERERLDRDRERHYTPTSYHNYQRSEHYDSGDRPDDEWRHVENMLHCIINMVDKTKRTLAVLQERGQRDRDELSYWMRRQADGLDSDMKKRTSEMMASTLRQTEDRVTEVKRRAEEAVQEVKRQAVAELQKAVAAAEAKASELVAAERVKMERAVMEARRQARDEALANLNQQEESSESCWNCGRKASETCSGCNTARYCSSFCQHKDWEKHHRVCGPGVAQAAMYAGSKVPIGKEDKSTTVPAMPPASSSQTPAGPPSRTSPAQLPAPSPPHTEDKPSTPTQPRSRSHSPTDPKVKSQEVAAH